MKDKRILLVPKLTKVEWDMKRLNLTEQELVKFYEKEGLNLERIFSSHKKQKESLEIIKKLLSRADHIDRDSLNKENISDYDIVISFGGDNHFQFVSHFIYDKPVLGINSDPERSEGALTNVSTGEFGKIYETLLRDNFEIKEWTRLKVEIDDKEINELAISEIFIGEKERFNMSRHIIKFNGGVEEQKGSGLLISTGAGSSGWYNSASRYLFPDGNSFPKTSREARFILTEPYRGRLSPLNLINGRIKENEEIEIISLSDSSPFISIDSLKLIKLREGARIKIRIGKPLRVIKLK
ncbi:MAG: hypothetical protein AABW75_03525 [Nanoarchaeota archaeon]